MFKYEVAGEYHASMEIKSSGLVHTAESDILRLQQILREAYSSGFTIFKELLQNAEDARANRMIVAGHPGFPTATNPLLKSPGLIVANNGPVLTQHMDGITRASGGSKADDRAAVGRFGLGQKSVYHLCDAFIALGRVEDRERRAQTLIMNPWGDVAHADAAREDWSRLSPDEGEMLLDKAKALGMDRGIVLYLPLRTPNLRPGVDLCLSDRDWSPDAAIDEILNGEELAATLSCLRNLESLEILPISGAGRRISMRSGSQRLTGPGSDSGPAIIKGQIEGAGYSLAFSGRQHWASGGRAAQLLSEKGWDQVFDIRGDLILPKANPHGAVIICRTDADKGASRLRLRNTVYLPLGEPVFTAQLEQGSQDIEILVHGYFFVSSDRRKLRDDLHIEARWNDELRREATLPLLLDAIADALPALSSDPERYSLVRALRDQKWWEENGGDACQGRALARCWPGNAKETWQIELRASLRPVIQKDATTLPRLKAAFPELEVWCSERGIKLSFGGLLTDADPRWPDDQLAELVRLAGPAVFQKGQVAETLATVLDTANPGPATQAALAEVLRQAISMVEQNFASAEKLRALVRLLPQDRVLVLPQSVENRALLHALIVMSKTVPIKAGWADDSGLVARQLSIEETIDLLAAVEPFLSAGGRVSSEASTLISHILRNGPSIEVLATDKRASELKVIPARRMQDDTDLRLSLGEIAGLKRKAVLFDSAPNKELSVLATAIAAPALYRVGLREGGLGELASAKKAQCLLAVVREAEQFGDARACGELAELLGAEPTRDELRCLIARDADLRAHVGLVELDQLGGLLDELVEELLQSKSIRLVASETAAELKKATRDRLGLRRVDLESLSDWLVDAQAAGTLPELDGAKAIALLKSGIDESVLKRLPLHQSDTGDRFFAAGELYRGRAVEIPPALVPLTTLVELWGDPEAASVQNRLIDRWGPEAIIRTALSASKPEQFTVEICDALTNIEELPADLADRLISTGWVASLERAWSVEQILNLPLAADQAFLKLVPLQTDYLMTSQLPECVRDESVCAHLKRYQHDRPTSFLQAAKCAAERGVTGLCIDYLQCPEDLRRLARAGVDLKGAAWPFVAAAMNESLTEEATAQIAEIFGRPDRANTIEQMNALAGLAGPGADGEAARSLYRAAFARNLHLLCNGGCYLPANLLAPSEDGDFKRADSLALNAAGVSPSALLRRDFAVHLNSIEEQPSESGLLVSPARPELFESVERAFSPLGRFDVGDGMLLALAMLGRDERVRRLASKWEGQRSFNRICDDLDVVADEQTGQTNANRDRFAELRFDVEFADQGRVKVRSVAGTDCMVELSGNGEAMLVECANGGSQRDSSGKLWHIWRLTLGPVAPANEESARALLDQFVRKLAPALMMGFDQHKQAISDLLASYLTSDQHTLDDTCNELRDVLHDRLEGIKTGPVMRAALNDYHREVHRDRNNAREALWRAAQSDDGARELLAATRQKIDEMGYAPHRVLFELYQNAVDAQAQWHGRGRFRVEAIRDVDQSISCLRVIHWGRPINQAGSDPAKVETEGHRRDLSNMLAISHSAKEGREVTGRFGLGFKTAHMLADEVRLASGSIALRIQGGMIPARWEDGNRELAGFHDRGRKATLIEIPIAVGRSGEALEAWTAFTQAAPLLAALGANTIVELTDHGAERSFIHEEQRLGESVSWLSLDGSGLALRFDLGDEFRLFLPFGQNGPHAFPDNVAQFWHLVPLIGERRRGAWLMEGRFPVDPGRTQLSGAADEKEMRFARLGLQLGSALIAFYDHCQENWASFAHATGLPSDGRESFWQRLVTLFAGDLASHGPERSLHKAGHGLARLLAERPLVPLAFGGTLRAGHVRWRLAGGLAEADAKTAISGLLNQDRIGNTVVTDEIGRLLTSLDLPAGERLDLPKLVVTLANEESIDPELATALSCLRSEAVTLAMTGEEDTEFREVLRDRRWLAEDGSWQPIRLLGFSQGNADEEQRAEFAPPMGRLSSLYEGPAFELAAYAREQAGHNENVWKDWVATANSSDSRQTAFIRYLVGADNRTVNLLTSAASWLPSVDELASSSLLAALTQDEKNRLLANLGFAFASSPIETGVTDVWKPDAEQALEAIAQWWRDNRDELRPAYDRAVYPEEFSHAALADEDKPAWFTMLALASFQTLGRIRPQQSRQFVASAMRDGWWQKLATIEPDDEGLQPFVERLRAWSDPNAEESYLIWRRCLPDLCMIARHLDSYRRLFIKLPAVIAQEGEVSLRSHLRPGFSHIAARMGVEAAPLARSLGIGANWLVRELARKGIYSQAQAQAIAPYGWSTAERVRRLASNLGMGRFEHGVDQGRVLHGAVQELVGDYALFDGDGDLPLHIITLSKHRDDLSSILEDANAAEWADSVEDNGDDDDA